MSQHLLWTISTADFSYVVVDSFDLYFVIKIRVKKEARRRKGGLNKRPSVSIQGREGHTTYHVPPSFEGGGYSKNHWSPFRGGGVTKDTMMGFL